MSEGEGMSQTTPPDLSHVRMFVTGLPKTALAAMMSEEDEMTDTTGQGEVKSFMTAADWRDWQEIVAVGGGFWIGTDDGKMLQGPRLVVAVDRHIAALLAENLHLRTENARLQAENDNLRKDRHVLTGERDLARREQASFRKALARLFGR